MTILGVSNGGRSSNGMAKRVPGGPVPTLDARVTLGVGSVDDCFGEPTALIDQYLDEPRLDVRLVGLDEIATHPGTCALSR